MKNNPDWAPRLCMIHVYVEITGSKWIFFSKFQRSFIQIQEDLKGAKSLTGIKFLVSFESCNNLFNFEGYNNA